MCTVLLRFTPGADWPLLVAAVRDEFVGRPWDPPAAHWPGSDSVGGRDRVAGGTWLAVAPATQDREPMLAALLNGAPLPPDGPRPSRGALPLAALAGQPLPDAAGLARYDRFHLVVATPTEVAVSSWDGLELVCQRLAPGDHILVNDGVDAAADPLVPHFAPVLAGTPTPGLAPGAPAAEAWDGWVDLLTGDGLRPDDPRALIVRREVLGRAYGSTSASLVALRPDGVRYDFSADPGPAAGWWEVAMGLPKMKIL